jgi:hypothetical protein
MKAEIESRSEAPMGVIRILRCFLPLHYGAVDRAKEDTGEKAVKTKKTA